MGPSLLYCFSSGALALGPCATFPSTACQPFYTPYPVLQGASWGSGKDPGFIQPLVMLVQLLILPLSN